LLQVVEKASKKSKDVSLDTSDERFESSVRRLMAEFVESSGRHDELYLSQQQFSRHERHVIYTQAHKHRLQCRVYHAAPSMTHNFIVVCRQRSSPMVLVKHLLNTGRHNHQYSLLFDS